MNGPEIEDIPPEWHRDYLKEREQAIADGDDFFISLDEFEEELWKSAVRNGL